MSHHHDQGDTYVSSHAKGSSAGSNGRQPSRLGHSVRGVRAGRFSFPGANGSGASSIRTLRALVGAVAATALFAVSSAPALAAAPSVTVQNATNVQYTTADVAGTVNTGGNTTQWRFEYITDQQFQENVTHSRPGFNEAPVGVSGTASSSEPVGGTIAGLHAGTTYHLRLFANNVHGPASAVAANFTTLSVAAPGVTAVEATEVEYATFAAKGKVEISAADPAFNATTCRFEVATQQQWEASGNAFPEGPFQSQSEEPVAAGCHPLGEPFSGIEPSGPGTTEVEANFNGPGFSPYNLSPYIRLSAGTTYHLRLVAGNQSGNPTMDEAGSTFATKPVAKAAVSGFSTSSLTSTSVHVSATVAPNAPPVTEAVKAGYNVHWFVTCVPDCGRPEGEVEAGQPATEIGTDLGLQPNLHYTATLHVVNAGGDETKQVSLTTPPVAPDVKYPFSGAAIDRTTSGARMVGLVNPHNSALTDCHFDYGTTTSYGSTAPCVGTPTGEGFTFVSAEVGGLQPGTTYHFRLVAGDATGPAVGGDQEFKTFPTSSAPSCPNEAVRAEQHAQALPECRAWEMASPIDKNGGNITGEGSNAIAATDGNAVEFVSRAGFANTTGTGPVGLTQYVARRGNDGWETKGITPTPDPGDLETFFGRTEAGVFSEDLTRAVFYAEDLPGPTDDITKQINIYQGNTLNGTLRTVTEAGQMVSAPSPFDFVNLNAVGASADAQVVAFQLSGQLLPEAEPTQNVYEWENGTLRLAGILPDGSVPTEGSVLPESASAGFYRYRESVSSDGARIAFLSRKEGLPQIYLRRNHTSTAWVTEPEGTGVTAPENVRLQWMSPDGKHLLFATTSKMLPADTNEVSDLYLYTDGPNPSAESNLQLISGPTHAAGREEGLTNGVLGASDDASRIYYLSEACGCGEYELNYWHGGVDRQISDHVYGRLDWGATSYPGHARVSRNGLTLALISEQQLTGDQTGGQPEMYVYDATTESLSCASCMASGNTDAPVPFEPRATEQGLTKELPQVRPHWLSDDGHDVFFTTSAPLVSADINGLPDVYSYNTETGQQKLLSSGKGEEGAWFENASNSGSDVFIVTNQHLVAKDSDELWDMYDVRVNGGFTEPPPPPTACSGDGCRGPLTSAPELRSPATSSFAGPGNPKPKRKKPHHKHREWTIYSGAPDSVLPGDTIRYSIAVANTGTAPFTGTITLTDVLPAGVTPLEVPERCEISGQEMTCGIEETEMQPQGEWGDFFKATVSPAATGTVTNVIKVEGNGTGPDTQIEEPLEFGPQKPFELDSFVASADRAGNPETQAGAAPEIQETRFSFYSSTFKALNFFALGIKAAEHMRNIVIHAPPGVVANLKATAVSDPIPHILQGLPVDLRQVVIMIDRPQYTLNPTSCDPMAVTGLVSLLSGQLAAVSSPFQVGGCANLSFKPKLALSLKGGTKRTKHPAFTANLTFPQEGGANIAKASVALPRSEFLDQAHIGTVCTRAQFAANACPPQSVYGSASASTPLLASPLAGPVYLRSSSHKLPDLVAALRGQFEIDLVGRIDSLHGGIRATFESVPDAPVSRFTLKMNGGLKGLLQNSTNICRGDHRATVLFDGQNGSTADQKPILSAKCGPVRHHGRRQG